MIIKKLTQDGCRVVRLCLPPEPGMEHDETEWRREDFADEESWLRFLHTGGLIPSIEHDVPYERPIGSGHHAELYKATHGHSLREFQVAHEYWGWSAFISLEQFEKAYAAVAAANCMGHVLNAFVSVTWSTLGVWHDEPIGNYHNRFLEAVRKWMDGKHLPSMGVWVLEVGKRRGLHSHLLLRIPRRYADAFRVWANRDLQTITRRPLLDTPESRTIDVQVRSDRDVERQWRWFAYIMKGLDPRIGWRFNDGSVRYVDQIAGLELRQQGEIARKRLGVSRMLDQKITANWPTDWPALVKLPHTTPGELYSTRYLDWYEWTVTAHRLGIDP